MVENDSSALLGRTIAGKFVVEAVIGRGGSGMVYRARHLALDRVVALKVLRDDVARDPQFVERFKREARAASRLDHPSSVRVLDFGWHDDSLLYLAMEHVEGRTLHQVIQDDGPLDGKRIVDILSQVLSALGVAHDMEVIHRDLKPDNIIIITPRTSSEGDGAEVAKVCDFGIATLGTVVHESGGTQMAAPSLTSHGFIIGTPAYMSPEQARGEPADRRSDIYSAGAVLYHMLAGRAPFDGDNALEIAAKQIIDEPRPPSAFAPVDLSLEAICLKALSKAPQDRFAGAREMRAALQASREPAAASQSPVVPPPTLVGLSARRPPRWPPLLVGTALAVIVAAVVAGGFIVRSGRRSRPADVASIPVPPARTEPPPSAPLEPPSAPSHSPLPATIAAAAPRSAARDKPAGPTRERWSPARRARRPATSPTAAPAASARAAAETPEAAVAAPSPVPAAPAAPAVPAVQPPTAAPPRPPLDVERARVSIAGVTTTSAIPASSIRAALGRSPFGACYRDALRARGSEATGNATLHLRIDVDGYVTARLDGAEFLPAMKACVEKAARMARVKDVDTGEATAEVTLSFGKAP